VEVYFPSSMSPQKDPDLCRLLAQWLGCDCVTPPTWRISGACHTLTAMTITITRTV
jgi:hypothetical protein